MPDTSGGSAIAITNVPDPSVGFAAITITNKALELRFPVGDFTDTYVRDLTASRQGSSAGEVRVRPWPEAQIARWYIDKDRFERRGRHIARAIRLAGRSPVGNGLVQCLCAWRCIPLVDPPKTSALIQNCRIDGRGWL